MQIGMFDSGVGGLSVLSACKRALPTAKFLYLDDSENRPYGNKSREEVIEIADRNVRTLLSSGCEAIVIACNTATAAAASFLRQKYDVPIIGIEPAVKPALTLTDSKILLLATPLTATLRTYPPRVTVSVQPTLACDIEKAYPDPKALSALAQHINELSRGYSGLVLGCTHYSHLTPYLRLPVFDGAEGVARRLKSIMIK